MSVAHFSLSVSSIFSKSIRFKSHRPRDAQFGCAASQKYSNVCSLYRFAFKAKIKMALAHQFAWVRKLPENWRLLKIHLIRFVSKSFKTRHSYQIYFYLHFYSFVFMTLIPMQSFSSIGNAHSSEGGERERESETEIGRCCWNKSWGFWTSVEKQIYQLSCSSLLFTLD